MSPRIELPAMTEKSLQGRYNDLRHTAAGRDILASRSRHRGKTLPADVVRRAVDHRPFVAWDGEGADDDSGRHRYILWGNSEGYAIDGPDLSTQACLDLIFDTETQWPNSFHVIFAGKYDVNMILKDCHYMVMNRLHSTGRALYGGYRLEYAPGKFFRVTRGKQTAQIFDVWAFFGTAFVAACREYLGESPELDEIERMKKERDSFTLADLPEIREYWKSELRYLVALMNKLRENLLLAGISIASWHGPGAIASKILSMQGIKKHMRESDENVVKVLQHAYAGGRPELLKGGMQIFGGTRFDYFKANTPADQLHQYDINSAYPAAIALLPSLQGSSWEYATGHPNVIRDFGLYHIRARTEFREERDSKPYPLFWRDKHGAVYYPKDVEGWYWGTEARLLEDYPGSYDSWEILESWTLQHRDVYPFRYIYEMYDQRKEWKNAGNPAHIAYKLGLNSKYGKMAQRIGAHKGGPPAWHQLEWAGWVTASARAQLYRAMMLSPGTVVSCSTDSVFSTVPLDLPCSDKLGEWEYESADGIIAAQSGVYWLLRADKETGEPTWKPKYRGFDKGTLTVHGITDYLRRLDGDPFAVPLQATSTRFMTWSQTKGSDKWRQWITTPRELVFGSPLSKRGHYPAACPSCLSGVSLADALHPFHTCGLPWIGKTMSAAHSLPWSDYGDDSLYPDFEEDMVRTA